MSARATIERWAQVLGALLVFVAVCAWRAAPAFHRGTYATEGGAWLGALWQHGLLHGLLHIREDYCVLGNLMVIKIADLLVVLRDGHPLGASGAFWQHAVAVVYVALQFLVVFLVLRAHHGWKRALGVAVVMLLAPDLDDENRVFGEANNVGFFSGLVVAAVVYDAWMTPAPGLKRRLGWLALMVFHVLTSPLAGLVTAGGAALMAGREVWCGRREGHPAPVLIRRIGYWLFPIVLVAATIWRASQHGPSAAMAEEAVGEGSVSAFREAFIDVVFGRQLLYPLLLDQYPGAGDGLVLKCLAAVLGVLALWAWAEWRQPVGRRDARRWLGLWLLAAIACGQAMATAWSRPWLLEKADAYGHIWPARYYLVQTMVMAGFFSLVLLRMGDLFPRARVWLIVAVAAMGARFALLQWPHLEAASRSADPAVDARRWAHQLGRVHDIHRTTGDLAAAAADQARVPGELPVALVEMYIDGHALPVPPRLLAGAFEGKRAKRDDLVPVDSLPSTEAGQPVATGEEPTPGLVVKALRAIPRAAGTLVTFDAQLPRMRQLSKKDRRLWLGPLAGLASGRAYVYSAPEPNPPRTRNQKLPDARNWMIKGVLWFPGPVKCPADLQALLQDVPVVVGRSARESVARGILLSRREEVPFSSLRDDGEFARRLHRSPRVWQWKWDASAVQCAHLEARDGTLEFTRLRPADFDEATYLLRNPDVSEAVASGLLRDGAGHFKAFGEREGREFAPRSVMVPLPGSGLTTDQLSGISVNILKTRGALPGRLRCVFHGPAGERAEWVLRPAEGGVLGYGVSFLPPGWAGNGFAIQRLELKFEEAAGTRTLWPGDIDFFGRP